MRQTKESVVYDGSYQVIAYPGGDIPRSRGACTDLVIRAYREVGIDLQVLMHEDMMAHFAEYPRQWGSTAPDSNIDHRRVPNLAVFFARHGASLAVTKDGRDYLPGDLVTWNVGFKFFGIGHVGPHIGIVSAVMTKDGKRPKIIHNIGWGPKLEDMLFDYPITGHYRFSA